MTVPSTSEEAVLTCNKEEIIHDVTDDGPVIPKYKIVHRGYFNMQDYTYTRYIFIKKNYFL